MIVFLNKFLDLFIMSLFVSTYYFTLLTLD